MDNKRKLLLLDENEGRDGYHFFEVNPFILLLAAGG